MPGGVSVKISSLSNPKINEFIKLRDKVSERQKCGMFTLEGSRIVLDAINEGAELCDAFYTEEAAKKYPETVRQLEELLGKRTYIVSSDVSRKLADTITPQGIYALAKKLDKFGKSVKIEGGGKFIVLCGLQNPGNIGTILRCADAVGVAGVFLCGGCDLYNPKLIRATMGSIFRLKISEADYFPLIDKLKTSGVYTYAAVVEKSAQSLRNVVFPKNCAVVIGNEGNGLSPEESDVCDKKITIKMSGSIESLNAATAASIILWELTKED